VRSGLDFHARWGSDYFLQVDHTLQVRLGIWAVFFAGHLGILTTSGLAKAEPAELYTAEN